MKPFDTAAFLDEFRREAAVHAFGEVILAETAVSPLVAYRKEGPGKGAYFSAGIHGDEPAGPLALLELLRQGAFDDDGDWILCPALNPTGMNAARRENDGGLDLNRDYLRRASVEVAAHVAWLEQQPVPSRFVSLHEDWEARGFYFYEINLGCDQPTRAARILDSVRPWLEVETAMLIDDHEVREAGWIYHEARPDFPDHWPEAIYLAERGCPVSFTLETPSAGPIDDRVAAHVAASRAVLATTGR